jgi:hypothetical protein
MLKSHSSWCRRDTKADVSGRNHYSRRKRIFQVELIQLNSLQGAAARRKLGQILTLFPTMNEMQAAALIAIAMAAFARGKSGKLTVPARVNN